MKPTGHKIQRTPIGQRRKKFSSTVSRRNKRRGQGQQPSLWPVIYTDMILAGIILAILSFLFFDQWVTGSRGAFNSWLVDFFQLITDIGKSEWILIPSGVFCLLMVFVDWQGLARRQQVWLSGLLFDIWFLFLAVAGSGILVLSLKQLAGRARPKHLNTLGYDFFDPLRFESSFTSLPSGHSVTIAALATVLALRFPKFVSGWIILALAIGTSRVMVGAHYPSDVIMGLTIGMLFTLFLARVFAARKSGFRFSNTSPYESVMPKRRIIRGRRPLGFSDIFSLAKRLIGISN
jgi:membrane-associated phospholipid phosphatase